jgi:hypothetical protein
MFNLLTQLSTIGDERYQQELSTGNNVVDNSPIEHEKSGAE